MALDFRDRALLCDEAEVIGGADFKGDFGEGDTAGGGGVEVAIALDGPAAGLECLVNFGAGLGFGFGHGRGLGRRMRVWKLINCHTFSF